jgi:hypothetical protein
MIARHLADFKHLKLPERTQDLIPNLNESCFVANGRKFNFRASVLKKLKRLIKRDYGRINGNNS